MSNIYLHRLDEFAERVLIPEYTRGRIRKQDTGYARVRAARDRAHKRGGHASARELRKQLRGMPSGDPRDPGFRRLHYARYADDTLLGFTGPRAEAEEIKQRLAAFLHDELKLELSQDKTLITHARTQAAKFLGYEITVLHNDRKVTRGRRSVNGVVSLRVPASVIKAKQAPYLSRGKPERRSQLVNDDDHTIVSTYGAEWRGIVQHYLLAGNVHRLYRLHWVMETSLLKTLANKHRSSVPKMARTFKAATGTPDGPRKCLEARVERNGRKPLVARFGGIPLRRQKARSSPTGSWSRALSVTRSWSPGSWRTGVSSARTRTASRCTTSEDSRTCTGQDGRSPRGHSRWPGGGARPRWSAASCHDAIHAGQPTPQLTQYSKLSGKRGAAHVPAGLRRGGRVAARTRQRHAAIGQLLAEGRSIHAIAADLGLARNTVRRFARAADPEELLVHDGTGRRTSILDNYEPYLRERWNAGCTDATALWRELRARGYPGGYSLVRDYLARFRGTTPMPAPPPHHPQPRRNLVP